MTFLPRLEATSDTTGTVSFRAKARLRRPPTVTFPSITPRFRDHTRHDHYSDNGLVGAISRTSACSVCGVNKCLTSLNTKQLSGKRYDLFRWYHDYHDSLECLILVNGFNYFLQCKQYTINRKCEMSLDMIYLNVGSKMSRLIIHLTTRLEAS